MGRFEKMQREKETLRANSRLKPCVSRPPFLLKSEYYHVNNLILELELEYSYVNNQISDLHFRSPALILK